MSFSGKRTDDLIRVLQLQPHPEGGYYREVFRSASKVFTAVTEEERSAVTTIYFLLESGNYSRLHRIGEDEIWHFYEGAPLELAWAGVGTAGHLLLGSVSEQMQQVAVVPAGCWQMARTTGEYTLAGCTVGPGFEFRGFELLKEGSREEREIMDRYPELIQILRSWTDPMS